MEVTMSGLLVKVQENPLARKSSMVRLGVYSTQSLGRSDLGSDSLVQTIMMVETLQIQDGMRVVNEAVWMNQCSADTMVFPTQCTGNF